jgi:DNA-binding transcriptional regulator YdaS (Cro superfamily)
MNIKDYLNTLTPDEREAFAVRAGTTDAYLQQLKGGHSKPSTKLCHKLVAASNGALTLEELRPDVWVQQVA